MPLVLTIVLKTLDTSFTPQTWPVNKIINYVFIKVFPDHFSIAEYVFYVLG